MRQFIYTKVWTIPVDIIVDIQYDNEMVTIRTDTKQYFVRSSMCKNGYPKDEYEEIQRQLMRRG